MRDQILDQALAEVPDQPTTAVRLVDDAGERVDEPVDVSPIDDQWGDQLDDFDVIARDRRIWCLWKSACTTVCGGSR
jgi:hypothetical protein